MRVKVNELNQLFSFSFVNCSAPPSRSPLLSAVMKVSEIIVNSGMEEGAAVPGTFGSVCLDVNNSEVRPFCHMNYPCKITPCMRGWRGEREEGGLERGEGKTGVGGASVFPFFFEIFGKHRLTCGIPARGEGRPIYRVSYKLQYNALNLGMAGGEDGEGPCMRWAPRHVCFALKQVAVRCRYHWVWTWSSSGAVDVVLVAFVVGTVEVAVGVVVMATANMVNTRDTLAFTVIRIGFRFG